MICRKPLQNAKNRKILKSDMKLQLNQLFIVFTIVFLSLKANGQIEIAQNIGAIDGFLENKGQMYDMGGKPMDFALFKIETPGLDFYITEYGATYLFKEYKKEPVPQNELTEKEKMEIEQGGKENTKKKLYWERVDLILEGASIKKENIVKEYESEQGHTNFFYAHCPQGISGVKEYGKITIKDIYPKIDWVFYNSSKDGYKYDFIVHSGANPSDIQLIYRSKNKLKLNNEGGLVINTLYGELKEEAPKTFLNEAIVKSSFKLLGTEKNDLGGYDNILTFEISANVKKRLQEAGNTLVIDPQLVWATYYGGNDFEGILDVETDSDNNVIMVGYTKSSNFPVFDAGSFFQGVGGTDTDDWCGFILKFNSNGVRLWATYYGGTSIDVAYGVALDQSDNIFVAGVTGSDDFPVQDAGTYFQGTFAGGPDDGFILKFDNLGNRIWATYYGAADTDTFFNIGVDNSGNVVAVGRTFSTDFPLQNSGGFFQASKGALWDIVIVKFDNSGNRLWSTFYGGNSEDEGRSLDFDSSDNLYITGSVRSTDFPLLNSGGFFQSVYGGGSGDAFVLKFDNTDNLLWSTYYGGSSLDGAYTVGVDNTDNIFLVGTTNSDDFPLFDAGTFFQGTILGAGNAFLLKFDDTENRQWSTYYGGSSSEHLASSNNVAFDKCGHVYFSFDTYSSDMLTQPFCEGGFYQSALKGPRDWFLSKFTLSGEMTGATYLGGDGNDFNSPIAIDNKDNLYLAGEFSFPTGVDLLTNPGFGAYFDDSFNGPIIGSNPEDGYIVKFSNTSNIDTLSTVSSCVCDGTATVTVTNLCPPYDYIWETGDQTLATSDTSNTITNLCAGIYPITVVAACDTLRDTVIVSFVSEIVTTINLPVTCDSIEVDDDWYFTSQILSDTVYGAIDECDSITNTVITIVNGVSFYQDMTVCDSTFIGDRWYYTSQAIHDTIFGGSVNGCDSVIITNLTVIPSPHANFSFMPTEPEKDQLVSFIDLSVNASSWAWDFGDGGHSNDQNPFHTYSSLQEFDVSLVVANENCLDSIAYRLVITEVLLFFVPNSFTPDGNSFNNVFSPVFTKGFDPYDYHLIVFNRWGETIFESYNTTVGWSGTYGNGQIVQDGVYVWQIEFGSEGSDKRHLHRGHVTLIR